MIREVNSPGSLWLCIDCCRHLYLPLSRLEEYRDFGVYRINTVQYVKAGSVCTLRHTSYIFDFKNEQTYCLFIWTAHKSIPVLLLDHPEYPIKGARYAKTDVYYGACPAQSGLTLDQAMNEDSDSYSFEQTVARKVMRV